MKVEFIFEMGDKVTIDGDRSIVGVVLAACVRGENTTYEVAWMHNGASNSAWVEEWRLEKWEG